MIEIDNSAKNSFRIFFIIMIGFFLIILFYIKKTNNSSVKTDLLNKERYAKVLSIYNNREEHNFTYVRFSNGEAHILYYPYEVGDSVSKKKGDSIEYIFRGNTILKHNFFDTARKNKSLTD